jgi:hypothetical protein
VCELQIARSEGGLHVLINNAGVFPLGPIELLAEEVWLACLARRCGICCAGRCSTSVNETLFVAGCSGTAWRWRWVRRCAVQPDTRQYVLDETVECAERERV